jgi:hypothetical protein
MIASHSFISKARAILMCILVIGALAEVSAYYYVQNYTSFPSLSASSALAPFVVANLTMNPYLTSVNQPVDISVNVFGNIQGSYSLNFNINGAVAETKKVTLSVNESETVSFSVTEASAGSYNVTVGDVFGIFTITSKPAPMPATLKLSNMLVNPTEIWPGQQVNVSVGVTNTGTDSINYSLPFLVNGQVSQFAQVSLAGGTSATVSVEITGQNDTGTYQVTAGSQSNSFSVAPEGEHTIHVLFGRNGLPFSLDGTSMLSLYTGLVSNGSHTFAVPSSAQINNPGWGLTNYAFSNWGDGSTGLSKTIDVEGETYVTANWIRLGSCPSLYVWNGISYAYASEVSDGTGWLGYLEYFNPDGTMVFSYNNPSDYIKLNPNQLVAQNGFYNMKIGEFSDEIFYLDSVKLVAIDHPANTDVFSTQSTWVYNLTDPGTIYTVSKEPALPVSAVNGQGQNVLPEISNPDGVYTNATMWTWNSLTLNLGNLTGAQEAKLVVTAKITWPTTSAGGANFMKYANEPGVMPSPPPYMEVLSGNGSWVKVPDNREFPLPDTNDDTFVVNLTGLFLTNNFELKINYYQNIQFDYIGVDTTTNQNVTVHTLTPSSADLEQIYVPGTNATGAFTRYGDVTALLQSADDKFVIGREGDGVSLQFPADLPPVAPGMVRDYYVIANCWFKGVGLPYVPFTVNPLPFQSMTSFPYPLNETYPYDADHQAYLQQYNTRIINSP